MANHMETYVRIKNGDINVAKKLKEIFTPIDGEYETDAHLLVNRIYDNPPEDADRSWMIDKVGAKWMYSEFEYDDECEDIYLRLTSAWSVPQYFLERLAKVLSDIKEDCYIVGTYEDEGFDPIGAFVYAKDYDDIEDYDEDIDYDKIWDDDTYRDELYEKNYQLQNGLEECYIDYLKDLKDENTET